MSILYVVSWRLADNAQLNCLCRTSLVSSLENIVLQFAAEYSLAQDKCQHQHCRFIERKMDCASHQAETNNSALCVANLARLIFLFANASMPWLASCKCRYVGTDGIYTHTAAYEQDPQCSICSPGIPFEVQSSMTLQQVTVSPSYVLY